MSQTPLTAHGHSLPDIGYGDAARGPGSSQFPMLWRGMVGCYVFLRPIINHEATAEETYVIEDFSPCRNRMHIEKTNQGSYTYDQNVGWMLDHTDADVQTQIDLPPGWNVGQGSVCCWVRFDQDVSHQFVFHCRGTSNNNNEAELYRSSGEQITFKFEDGSSAATQFVWTSANGAPANGDVVHIGMTWGHWGLEAFCNGEIVGTDTLGGSVMSAAPSRIEFGDAPESSRNIRGYQGHPMLWNRRLSADEIKTLYIHPYAPLMRRPLPLFVPSSGTTVTPNPVSATWSVPGPSTTIAVTPSPVSATFSVPVPTTVLTNKP